MNLLLAKVKYVLMCLVALTLLGGVSPAQAERRPIGDPVFVEVTDVLAPHLFDIHDIYLCKDEVVVFEIFDLKVSQEVQDCETYDGVEGCNDPYWDKYTGPIGYTWSGATSDPGSPSFASFPVSSPAGDYTVTCTVGAGSATHVSTWTVHVRQSGPPPCEDSDCSSSDSGGCGSGSCGGDGGGFPWPDLRAPECHVGLQIPGGIGGPGNRGGSSGPGKGCKAGQYETVDMCDGVYVKAWDCIGKCNVFGPFTEGQDFSFCAGAKCYTGHVGQNRSVTIKSANGESADFGRPGAGTGFEGYPGSTNDASGNTTTYSRASNGALESVTEPSGDVWTYEHTDASFPTQITKVTAPDGTYALVGYHHGGAAAGNPESVTVPGSDGVPVSETTYTYDEASGRVTSATRGTKKVTYGYDDTDNAIAVKECSALSPNTVYTWTVYHYGQASQTGQGQPAANETWVIRKWFDPKLEFDPAVNSDPSKDEVTKHAFYTDTNGKKTYASSIADAEGNTTSYAVDTAAGLTTQVTDPAGVRTKYAYDLTTRALTSTTVRKPDPDNTILSQEESTYCDDVNGNRTTWQKTHKDVRGNYTYYRRNLGTLWLVDEVKVSAPVGGQAPSDAQWNATSPIAKYEYYGDSDPDGLPGQLKKEIVPAIDTTTQPATDQVTEYKYTESGKRRSSPTRTIRQYWNGTAYEPKTSYTSYDDMGRRSSATDANGRTIQYTYDALGRQLKTIYRTGIETESHYTCCTMDWSKDENGNKTYYVYDDLNRLERTWTDVQVLDWSGKQVVNGQILNGQDCPYSLVECMYDAFGNQEKVTTYSDASTPRVTTYTYDKNNKVTKIDYPGGVIGSEEYGYDDLGNVWWKRDGNGAVTLYEYDDHNRLEKVYYNYTGMLPPSQGWAYPSAANVTYAYDGNSSLKTSMVDGSGASSYTYDSQDRLKTYTPPVGLSSGHYVWYDYDNAGQKTEIKITNGADTPYDVTYDYFANGWLKDVKSSASVIASYGYGAVGNRQLQANANNTSTEYVYSSADPRYFVDSTTHKSGTTTLATIGYLNRDNAGNPLSMSDWTGSWSYGYDTDNRLTSATPPDPVPGQPAGGAYGYDWVGNRQHPATGPNPMVHNDVDQLTSWPGMCTYTYYGDGSLQYEKNADGTQTMKSYTYTADGLLDEAEFNFTNTATCRYLASTWDAGKNRVQYESGTRVNENHTAECTHTLVYDTTAGIPAVIAEDGIYYIREPSGKLIARMDDSGSRYYHFDQLGSTRLLTDCSGNVTDQYAYDTYGAVISHDRYAGSVDQPYQFVGGLGYYTHWQEPGCGLLQLGRRFYAPTMGEFTQRDEVMFTGYSDYSYVWSTPTRFVDPTGEAPSTGYPDYEPFIKCVLGELASTLAKQVAVCAALCAGLSLGNGEITFAPCFATCMGLGSIPTGALVLIAIVDCMDKLPKGIGHGGDPTPIHPTPGDPFRPGPIRVCPRQ